MKFFQFDLLRPRSRGAKDAQCVEYDGKSAPILFRQNALARRYRLFVDREGRPRVTIPRRGSRREAERFVNEHREWLVGQLRQFEIRSSESRTWRPGTTILFRGIPALLEASEDGSMLRLADERISVRAMSPSDNPDFRPFIERHLRLLAVVELPVRVMELARTNQCPVKRVTVRNQSSRWGSCSRRGTISLNWRLIQAPPSVRDYIILHELMHLREMNHSRHFWAHVQAVCPDYRESEAWLKAHSSLLR